MTEPYILFTLGAMLTIIGSAIAFILNGIKGEIRNVNDKLERIETDLHNRVTEVDRRHQDQMVDLDRRVSKIEARCEVKHGDEK